MPLRMKCLKSIGKLTQNVTKPRMLEMLFFVTYFDCFPSLFVFDIAGAEHVLQGDFGDVVLLVVHLAQAEGVLQPFLERK